MNSDFDLIIQGMVEAQIIAGWKSHITTKQNILHSMTLTWLNNEEIKYDYDCLSVGEHNIVIWHFEKEQDAALFALRWS